MNLRHHYKTASALLICFLLHSCDGGGDGGGEDDGFGGFNLDARYDRFALEQDLTGVPQMPRNLISTDKIIYTDIAGENQLTDNNIKLPTSVGQEEPWVLTPNVAGAVEIEEYVYTYSLDEKTNLYSLISDSRGVDSDAVDALGDAGLNRSGSWGAVRPKVAINEEPAINDAGRSILQDALSGLGFLSVVTPNVVDVEPSPFQTLVPTGEFTEDGSPIFAVTEAAWQIKGIMLLGNRKITHTVTSTNEDILNSGVIRGTFTLKDIYQNLYFYQSTETDGWEVRSGVLTITRIPRDNSQPQEISPEVTGKFTLELGDGGFGFGDPNP